MDFLFLLILQRTKTNPMKEIIATALTLISLSATAHEKLTGTVIGTTDCVDYTTGQKTTTVNTAANAFDGNPDTFFATYDRSYTWAGLDLGTKHVITKVGWMPRNDATNGERRVQLAVFEGANSPDFLDAVPIYIVPERGTLGQMEYAEVNCSRGFRYVRYIGPSDARCNVAEVEFYGTEGEGDDSHLYQLTNLPTVVISTQNFEAPYDKENEIAGRAKIISEGGTKILDAEMGVRERGNGSRQFPKKPWRIKFSKKQNVLDAPAKAKKWTLLNNYGDKTLMRNKLAFDIARQFNMEYVPYCTFVDVVLNGEYKGTYQLCDQVEVNPGRVEIDEMEPTDISGEALTGGYFIEADAYAYSEISWFKTASWEIPFTIKSPDDGAITSEQSAYIKNYLDDVEDRLRNKSASDLVNGYRAIFDVKSFAKHMLVNEICSNTDTYWSTYMYKKRGDKVVYTGPIWDIDLGFDNDGRTYPVTQTAATQYLWRTRKGSFANNMYEFVNRVFYTDYQTENDVLEVWREACNKVDGLSVDWFNNKVDEYAAMLNQSQKLNFTRWDILNTRVHENPVARGSYEAEVQHVKDYFKDRLPQLDKIIGYDRDKEQGGIEDIFTDAPADDTWYNLQGIALPGRPTLPGIYINAGKKVVIK